jgi:putative oxidoreductase
MSVMVLVRRIARPMLSSMFISGGMNSLKSADYLAKRAEPVTDKVAPVVEQASWLPVSLDSKQMVQLNGAVHLVGGALLAMGKVPRLAALALAASLVPTTAAGHRFWEESDPQQRSNQRVHFLKNVSMMGGLLLASVDTEGKPSMAWQAKRGATRAKKRATNITPG